MTSLQSTYTSGQHKQRDRRAGFTLLQLLVVIAVIVLLAGISFGILQRSRRSAQRATCDVHLKALALALDAFRQEQGKYPTSLSELVAKKYITDPSLLRCPLDPRPGGSYEDYYIFRNARPLAGDKRDQSSLPLIVCPFHEDDTNSGIQAFRNYTQQFATQPATLAESTGATVERPGQSAISARAGMTLRGGDRVQTTGGGTATIRFADGSMASLSSNADVTVLQSFLTGHTNAPLYTVLRQRAGEVLYRVTHGSKFDVATPTATAGALGTEFRIKKSSGTWYLKVTESKVLCAMPSGSEIYKASANLTSNSWNNIGNENSSTSSGDDDDDDNCGDGKGHGEGVGCK